MREYIRACGPYICYFPAPSEYKSGDRWTCKACGTTYKLTRPKPKRWWSKYFAPDGYWRVTWRHRHHRPGMLENSFIVW